MTKTHNEHFFDREKNETLLQIFFATMLLSQQMQFSLYFLAIVVVDVVKVEVVVAVDVVKGIIVVVPIPTVSEGKRETNN